MYMYNMLFFQYKITDAKTREFFEEKIFWSQMIKKYQWQKDEFSARVVAEVSPPFLQFSV